VTNWTSTHCGLKGFVGCCRGFDFVNLFSRWFRYEVCIDLHENRDIEHGFLREHVNGARTVMLSLAPRFVMQAFQNEP
jgi:hypothetical protein